jgi:hypothetical protein
MERLLTGDFLPLSAEWQPIFAVFRRLPVVPAKRISVAI